MNARRARIDTLLVTLGLAPSRERARALILAGRVRAGGVPMSKPGQMVAADSPVELIAPDHPWVGRGGVKLADALDRFGIPVEGRTALDIGASTGGFTDVLLSRGATQVVALDVGHGQLDWRLRSDPRVHVLERVNARHLTPDRLPAGLRAFDLVTIDVSFISLRHVLPVLPPLLRPDADVVALVKPQFEAGRDEVGRGGIVRDPGVRARVLEEVAAAALAIGLARLGDAPAALRGAEGNQEHFLHLRPAAGGRAQDRDEVK